jgi:hypothetical protein
MVDTLREKLSRANGTQHTGGAEPSAEQRETLAYCLQEVDRCLDWLKRN